MVKVSQVVVNIKKALLHMAGAEWKTYASKTQPCFYVRRIQAFTSSSFSLVKTATVDIV